MDAEDCMQETFMKAFEKIDAIEDAPPEAWVKRIAINTSINRLKKNCINFVDLDHPAVVYNDEDEDFEEGSTPAEEMVERIRVRMKELPDKYRVILSLYLFEGYDHGEIAEILDLKETTVRSQFIRGKQKLIELVTKNDKLCI
jgi:RNA polymerase sigma factor, sigma-70 family